MDFTSLDAIEFFQDNKKHIRAYYQGKDDLIRESSFEDGHGWFTRGDGVIASNAKSKSPITATSWNVGNESQIRLYYLDNQYNICECQGHHTSGVTTWAYSVILQNGNVAPGSQLAVARPEKDDTKLRVFYQENPDTSGKHPVREILYYKGRRGRAGWQVLGPRILGARENSRLSAVSARKSKDVRLYYQGESGFIMESFWDNAGIGRWETNDSIPPYQLVPKAPISALCWYAGDDSDNSNLRIRIYTILESHGDQIAELSYQEGWDTEPGIVAHDALLGGAQPPSQRVEYSAVAASRDTKADLYRPNCVFYQPGPDVINVTPVAADDGEEYDREASNVVTPGGIPKSRDALNHRVPQTSGTTGTHAEVAQLTAELTSKDAEINRLTGLLAAANIGSLSPSDFGSSFTTWQDVKAEYDRTKADLIACRNTMYTQADFDGVRASADQRYASLESVHLDSIEKQKEFARWTAGIVGGLARAFGPVAWGVSYAKWKGDLDYVVANGVASGMHSYGFDEYSKGQNYSGW